VLRTACSGVERITGPPEMSAKPLAAPEFGVEGLAEFHEAR
jgi:hypothetical protein